VFALSGDLRFLGKISVVGAFRGGADYKATVPRSDVRIRIASVMSEIAIFPSPTSPVRAALVMALTAA
jgi:hypothetical protein